MSVVLVIIGCSGSSWPAAREMETHQSLRWSWIYQWWVSYHAAAESSSWLPAPKASPGPVIMRWSSWQPLSWWFPSHGSRPLFFQRTFKSVLWSNQFEDYLHHSTPHENALVFKLNCKVSACWLCQSWLSWVGYARAMALAPSLASYAPRACKRM